VLLLEANTADPCRSSCASASYPHYIPHFRCLQTRQRHVAYIIRTCMVYHVFEEILHEVSLLSSGSLTLSFATSVHGQ
jgi:hypothetical protein